MMHVVQDVVIESEASTDGIEKLRHVVEVFGGRPQVLGGYGCVGRFVEKLVFGYTLGGR